jgi:hypothetical protein
VDHQPRALLEKYPLSVEDAGELNFLLTRLIMRYANVQGLKYKTINDILGALEGAKMEFYRRVVVKYEDSKREENGDVY